MSRFKLGLILGLGIGYVLGTKAGRERYLQMQRNLRRASRLWQKASSSTLAQKAAHKAGGALGDGLKSAKRTTIGKLPWTKDRTGNGTSKNHHEAQEPASSF
jgi:alkylated DNA repair dioxygenase AlkB